MSVTSWIDKKLDTIKKDSLFLKYFYETQIREDEGLNYLFNSEKGIGLVLSDILVVQSIHLFAKGNSSSKEYKDEIPYNLNFSMSRLTIKEKLGEPKKSSERSKDMFGDIPAWDKFYFRDHSLHLQYGSENNIVDLITFGSLSLESYFNIGLQ